MMTLFASIFVSKTNLIVQTIENESSKYQPNFPYSKNTFLAFFFETYFLVHLSKNFFFQKSNITHIFFTNLKFPS